MNFRCDLFQFSREMEDWQIKHITKNLNHLNHLTTFNCVLKDELLAKDILCKADVDKLVSQLQIVSEENLANNMRMQLFVLHSSTHNNTRSAKI